LLATLVAQFDCLQRSGKRERERAVILLKRVSIKRLPPPISFSFLCYFRPHSPHSSTQNCSSPILFPVGLFYHTISQYIKFGCFHLPSPPQPPNYNSHHTYNNNSCNCNGFFPFTAPSFPTDRESVQRSVAESLWWGRNGTRWE